MEEALLKKEADEEERPWKCATFLDEIKAVGYIGGPMAVITLSQYLQQTISLMMAGHLGELSLSGAAVATSLAGVTGFSFLLGLASALETLCGQAYGAKQYQKLGVQTQRAIFSLILVCLPISLLWMFMERILLSIGQDPEISMKAGRYITWLIPSLFAYAVFQALTKYLQSQSLILPMLIMSVATVFIHIPLCWVLVLYSGMSTVGAALALDISSWCTVSMLSLYVMFSSACEKTRAPISTEVFHGIDRFFYLAIPSALMICLEWWSFELIILLAGFLPNPKLETSVLSVCLNTTSFLYALPYGIGAAASTRISNELGAGRPRAAKLAVLVVMSVALAETAVISSVVFCFRNVLGYAFSNEKEVVDFVINMVPLVCLSIITDSLMGVLSGIARGCGWQHLGALVNLGAYYLVGIPIAAFLGFTTHLQGKGLWLGILTGAAVQSALLVLITSLTNWQKQAAIARDRVFEKKLLSSNDFLK